MRPPQSVVDTRAALFTRRAHAVFRKSLPHRSALEAEPVGDYRYELGVCRLALDA